MGKNTGLETHDSIEDTAVYTYARETVVYDGEACLAGFSLLLRSGRQARMHVHGSGDREDLPKRHIVNVHACDPPSVFYDFCYSAGVVVTLHDP